MSFPWFISIVIHRLNENPLMQILKKALSFLVNDVCGRLYLTKHDLVKTVIINSRFLCIFKICKFSLTLVFSWTLGNDVKHHRDHSYSTCANFSKKLPFYPLDAHTWSISYRIISCHFVRKYMTLFKQL